MSNPSSLKRRLAAVLAADVVGYGFLMEADESDTLARLKARRREVLVPLLERYAGRIVKLMGDGVLVEFASAVNAVLCAAELQDRMAKANETEGHSQNIQWRIGINVGDVIVEGSDIYGDGVNIAARLEAIAEPGGILISPTVHDQVRSKVELSFVDLGPQTLKNVSEPMRVFAVAGQRATGLSGQIAATSSGIADSTKPSIAVLPFGDLGGNASEAYFTDGIIEEVILELSRFTELLVIARNSSFAFRDQNMDLRTIAQKLNVQYVVTGSLKRADKRIRLNVQLIEAATGANLWAERYDRQLTDIFDLQEELAHTLAITLGGRVKSTALDRAQRRATTSMTAYDWYLRGRHFLTDYPHAKLVEESAKHAIEIDPEFAQAHALLAFGYCVHFLATTDQSFLDRALPHGMKAIELAPNDVFTNVAMGFVLRVGPRYREGLRYAARAVELNPNDTLARMMYAVNLTYYDRIETAIEAMEFVFRRDPYPLPWFWDVYGLALTVAERYDDGIATFERLTEVAYWAYCYRAVCEHYLGRPEAARESVRQAVASHPGLTISTLVQVDPVHAPGFSERRDAALLAAGLLA